MKKLLVTGASGFLGGHLCAIAPERGWQVVGTYHHQPVRWPQVEMVQLNLCDRNMVQQTLARIGPDAVIHAAAWSKVNQCQQHPEAAYAVNVTATLILTEWCTQAQIPLLFTSTDLVFDGNHAPYRETDPPSPISVYGQQKAEAERKILERYPGATICRLPLLFGAATPTADCFLQSFVQTLREGRPLNLFTDEFRSPVSATVTAEGLLMVLDRAVTGILHLGSRERLSRYEMGLQMVQALDLPDATLHPCTHADVNLSAPRPKDATMDSRKALALGFDPPLFYDALLELKGKV